MSTQETQLPKTPEGRASALSKLDIPEGSLPIYLETSDVARVLLMSYSGVRWIVATGRLLPAAVTTRGTRLFAPVDVEALRISRGVGETR